MGIHAVELRLHPTDGGATGAKPQGWRLVSRWHRRQGRRSRPAGIGRGFGRARQGAERPKARQQRVGKHPIPGIGQSSGEACFRRAGKRAGFHDVNIDARLQPGIAFGSQTEFSQPIMPIDAG
jgi:hypothetical protein